MVFDHLPLELLSLVLRNVDSPLGLYHLISASPSCFRAFSLSRQIVLSAVINNALLDENLQNALAILQAPSAMSQVPSFLDKYFDPLFSFDFPTNMVDVLALYRLYNRLSYLLDGYLEKTMQQLSLHQKNHDSTPRNRPDPQSITFQRRRLGLPDKNDDNTPPNEPEPYPSTFERTRLQRAFLRFELYCRAFPGHETHPYGPPYGDRPPLHHPADQQFSLFLAHIPPWEAEEMCCVEQYYYSLVGRFIDELTEEMIHAVMTAPGVVLPTSVPPTPASPSEEQPAEEEPAQKGFEKLRGLELMGLDLFSSDGKWRMPEYISYMTALGLDFMYTLVSDESKRAEMIRSNTPVNREFMPEALMHAPGSPTGFECVPPLDMMSDDDPTHYNLGYYLFRSAEDHWVYRHISRTGGTTSELRQLGYVFWDMSRIQCLEVSEALITATKISYEESALRFDRRGRESAEDRLRGIQLPRKQLDRIVDEFGSTLLR